MKRLGTIFLVLFTLLIMQNNLHALKMGPQPGEVYKEFTLNLRFGDQWRVHDPTSTSSQAAPFLPNPILNMGLSDVATAIKAEVLIDLWGGHDATFARQLRFNNNSWITIPDLTTTPKDPNRYMQQEAVIINVPLSNFKDGNNTLEGRCKTGGNLVGQFGWYLVVVRLYYNPSTQAHPTGQITSPAPGATIGDNPKVTISVQSSEAIARVEYLAYYDGYDEGGDGFYKDWHRMYRPYTVDDPSPGNSYARYPLHGNVDLVISSPYEVTWDNVMIPDQSGMRLVARIRDVKGFNYVTSSVDNLSLARSGASVKMYKASNVPSPFWVVAGRGAVRSCNVAISNLTNAANAFLHLRTWNGQNAHHEYIKLGAWSGQIDGANHNYLYNIKEIPVSKLAAGNNTFEVKSTTGGQLHHGPEIRARSDCTLR